MRQRVILAIGLMAWTDALEIIVAKGYLGRGDLLALIAPLLGLVGVLSAGFLLIGTAVRSSFGALSSMALCFLHIIGLAAYAEVFTVGCLADRWIFYAVPWLLNLLILGAAGLIGSLARSTGQTGWDGQNLERRCGNCGYNLTGNLSGVCPECGTPISGRKPQT